MVVLVLVVVMSTVIIVSMGPMLADARSRTACRTVISAMSYARSYAVVHRRDTAVQLDRTGVGVVTHVQDPNGEEHARPITTQAGRYHSLPDGVEISQVKRQGTKEENRTVVFTQFGQAEDVAVVIHEQGGRERIVSLDAITGRCRVLIPDGRQ